MSLGKRLVNVLVVLALTLTFTIHVYGAVKYKDVPETYWAYTEINDVSDRGLIVGDASGNFKPDAPIDKFETTRILAKTMGYKYTNVTEEERSFYKQAYEKNKSVIAQYAKPYLKWKSAYDYEIAFLLEKEIFTVEDLSQFIVKDANGVQQYRALSKQEAAVYIVRVMGLKSDALSGKYDMNLSDDADIKKAYKPYVYYLLKLGILNNDAENKFRPNEMVTRASLSVMLSDSLNYIEHKNEKIALSATAAQTTSSSSSTTQIVSLTGNISKFYPESDSIQITAGSDTNVFKLAPSVSIYIDSFLKTRADLKEGMAVKAVLSNNQIIDIQASGLSLNSSVMPVSNRQFSTVEGTVNEIRNDDSNVAIDLSLMNPDGRPGDSKTFVLDKNCKITLDGSEISIDKLNAGDVVLADISGGICLHINVEAPHREIRSGTLLKKQSSGDADMLEIKDQSGSILNLTVDGQATIARQNSQADFADLRMGDMIDAVCTYDRLTSISAQGFKTELAGTVKEIHITADDQSIVLKADDGVEQEFYIIPDKVDVYTLRIGMNVHLSLDSWEIDTVEIMN